jgi:hypothetical protein
MASTADRRAVLHRLYPAHSSTITPPTRTRPRFSRYVPLRIERILLLRSSRRTTSSSGASGSVLRCMGSHSRRGGSSRCAARSGDHPASDAGSARVAPRGAWRTRPRTWWIVSCPQPRTTSGSLPCQTATARARRDPAWARWTGALVQRHRGLATARRAQARPARAAHRRRHVRAPLRRAGEPQRSLPPHRARRVFVDDARGLRFELLPVPTNVDVLAILDRLLRRSRAGSPCSQTPMASMRTRVPTRSHRCRPTQPPPGARRQRHERPSAASSGSARGAKASSCMRPSSSPPTIAPRSNGCAGTALGPRSRRSASRGRRRAHRLQAQATVARRAHPPRHGAARVPAPPRRHHAVPAP